ncbi:MAG TPA: ABC transporter permease, partial [Planctomycetaceae bacterium]|nr:ABC transporter permease [Planctomycetaceae bacterium]
MAAVLAVSVVGVGLWQAAVVLWDIPQILLPSPSQVLTAAWENRGALAKGFLSTATAAVLGLSVSSVVGFITAIVLSLSKTLRQAMYPYIVFLQTVPIVAIAPLLITWSGYEFRTVVLVSAIISFFPIVS